MPELILSQEHPAEVDPADWQQLFAAWARDLAADETGAITVSFVSREEMEALVASHTAKTAATDVLSFRYDPPLRDEQGTTIIGEVAICPAVAADFANTNDLALRDEYATLFVHGLLHLTGRDHADAESRRRFEADTHAIIESGGYQTVSLWLD